MNRLITTRGDGLMLLKIHTDAVIKNLESFYKESVDKMLASLPPVKPIMPKLNKPKKLKAYLPDSI